MVLDLNEKIFEKFSSLTKTKIERSNNSYKKREKILLTFFEFESADLCIHHHVSTPGTVHCPSYRSVMTHHPVLGLPSHLGQCCHIRWCLIQWYRHFKRATPVPHRHRPSKMVIILYFSHHHLQWQLIELVHPPHQVVFTPKQSSMSNYSSKLSKFCQKSPK